VFITVERSAGHKVPPSVIGYDTPPSVEATVHNTSEQPVYDVELGWYKGTASDGDPKLLGVIMPGTKTWGIGTFPRGQSLNTVARSSGSPMLLGSGGSAGRTADLPRSHPVRLDHLSRACSGAKPSLSCARPRTGTSLRGVISGGA
jgi:hypothetical protein